MCPELLQYGFASQALHCRVTRLEALETGYLETPSWHSVVIKPAIRHLRWIVNYSSGTTRLISVVGDIKSGVRLAGRMRIVVLSFEDMLPDRVRQNNCMAPRM